VTIGVASDDAARITGVSIAQPGTAHRWRREADAVLHLLYDFLVGVEEELPDVVQV